jgi:CHAD domain-containing protein
MAFELKLNEPVGAGITRSVKAQIEKALKHLGASGESGITENEAIGEVRKCFKRVRAALRIARDELGTELYREENFRFRDAARPLTQIRDAGILVDTADKLRPEVVKVIGPAAFKTIRTALVANQQEVRSRVIEQNKALATVKDAAIRAIGRLAGWKLQRDGWAAVEPGLHRVYQHGHHAMRLATESPSVANLHEWRKQTKYLWHQLQLLDAAWTDIEKEFVTRTHQLATLLGEDHDLAVLRETLAADPLAYGGHHILKNVFLVIDRHRAQLEQQAFALGREIYKDPPRVFTSRIAARMHYAEVAG